MPTHLLVDLVVLLHLGFAAFVTLGFVVLLAGWGLGWRWVRGRRWRALHVACIALVALEALAGWACPLTVLEQHLRERAGLHAAAGSFMGRLAYGLLYYNFPPWVFTAVYVALAALALLLWRLIPPRPAGPRGLD
jgi:hypothetical protein